MNKLKFFRQTLIGLKVQVVISIFTTFIVLSRFAYVFYLGDNDVKGDFLDFPWLSSFLYACGVEVSYLSFALILAYATRFMEEKAKKPFLFLAYAISFVGFFFTSWILLDENRYNSQQEMLFSFFSALLVILVVYFLSKFVNQNQDSISKLKSKIRFVMNKMIVESVKNNHVGNKKRWQEEIVEPTLDKLNE